jgi:hypothetical protein
MTMQHETDLPHPALMIRGTRSNPPSAARPVETARHRSAGPGARGSGREAALRPVVPQPVLALDERKLGRTVRREGMAAPDRTVIGCRGGQGDHVAQRLRRAPRRTTARCGLSLAGARANPGRRRPDHR